LLYAGNMQIGFYINKTFTLDTGERKGVNVMFFSGEKLDYWYAEIQYDTLAQANDALDLCRSVGFELMPVKVKDCPNE